MSPTPVELFLLDVDAHWPLTAPRIPLKVFGSTALMLQTTYVRGTKDSDMLGVDPILGTMAEDLLRLAGKDSTLHRKHQIYLDVVSAGVPFFPHPTHWLPATDLNARLRSFEVQLLDITDVVVSKLKRFSDSDRNDIKAMIDRELIDHALLVERFLSAADVFSMGSQAVHVIHCAKNLNWVEREYLGDPETEYELPPWADA